jgi:hypothetical protein
MTMLNSPRERVGDLHSIAYRAGRAGNVREFYGYLPKITP